MFTETHYKGKPCVYDKNNAVFHTGFKTMTDARNAAHRMNDERYGFARPAVAAVVTPARGLRTYIVQARMTDDSGLLLGNGRLTNVGEFIAQSNIGAIVQAAHQIARGRERACEIIATLKL